MQGKTESERRVEGLAWGYESAIRMNLAEFGRSTGKSAEK